MGTLFLKNIFLSSMFGSKFESLIGLRVWGTLYKFKKKMQKIRRNRGHVIYLKVGPDANLRS